MKLTIIRLQHFSAQDRLDLAKIWPDADLLKTEEALNEQHRLYAAKFNERLLAAVIVMIKGNSAEMQDFMVREVTRRRGVGKYLLEEVMAQNGEIHRWWIADTNCNESDAATAFMQAAGFKTEAGGWAWQQN
ncbi:MULTISPECIES: aspartate 1-decarboxylase autocleavage activator PanM [Erwinia]|uniref:PanD regulatory factor n=2 Tax=Erwinia TaxID=551 RepID=A0A014NBP6_9GAMM|nr:aspartate 1-decarboxylase autocleavage activator PanM [Erwinia mallotivora]EXU76808.1 acetyltransferase [Erwinia mallotivora]